MDRIDLHRKIIREQEEKPKVERALKIAEGKVELSAYRNERNLMLFPFCSTARKTRFTPIRYETADGNRWLEVSPNVTHGMAKIWDFDVLRYALSKAGEVARMDGCTFPPFVVFSAYECLKGIGRRPKGKASHKWLQSALLRLSTTSYLGNIFRENEKITSSFSLISVDYVYDEVSGLERIRINFDERLIESIRYAKGLLEINPDVISEDSGLKKRLLELVKTCIGKDIQWTVGLARLQKLCAHEGDLKEFKRQIKGFRNLEWSIYFSPRVGGGENISFSKQET